MVRFEDDRLVIEIRTLSRNDSVERWLDLHAGLCDLLRSLDQDTICTETFYAVPDFLQELVPDYDDLKTI